MKNPFIRTMSTAVKPWDSIHSRDKHEIHRDHQQTLTDQRDIDECLSCPKPECTNCKRYACYRHGYVSGRG